MSTLCYVAERIRVLGRDRDSNLGRSIRHFNSLRAKPWVRTLRYASLKILICTTHYFYLGLLLIRWIISEYLEACDMKDLQRSNFKQDLCVVGHIVNIVLYILYSVSSKRFTHSKGRAHLRVFIIKQRLHCLSQTPKLLLPFHSMFMLFN